MDSLLSVAYDEIALEGSRGKAKMVIILGPAYVLCFKQ